MNYGYADLDDKREALELLAEDERYRFHLQLYHHLLSGLDIKGKKVLEVGCGRGGGASFIMRYLQPESVTATDISARSIAFCRRIHQVEGLAFLQADAGKIPFADADFDIVINVESSHCYPSMDTFLAEVHRTLRPKGHFLFTDFRHRDKMNILTDQLRNSGMAIIQSDDITRNVLTSMELYSATKLNWLKQTFPKMLQKPLIEFGGIKGGAAYKAFETGKTVYTSHVLQKPGEKETS